MSVCKEQALLLQGTHLARTPATATLSWENASWDNVAVSGDIMEMDSMFVKVCQV